MNVFDYSMKMEQDGEAFYRKMAEQTNDKGLQAIFTMLADEEVKHYKTFKGMKEGRTDLPETPFLKNLKNVFEEMEEGGGKVDFGDQTRDQYETAKEIELKSEEFYREQAENVKGKQQQEVMLKIADEERKHFEIVDNMMVLMERPERWLEDAEWRHNIQY